jgi:hypothetical protein
VEQVYIISYIAGVPRVLTERAGATSKSTLQELKGAGLEERSAKKTAKKRFGIRTSPDAEDDEGYVLAVRRLA